MANFKKTNGAGKRVSSRREFLQEGVALATGTAAFSMLAQDTQAAPQSNEDARMLDRLERANSDPARRILFKGGVVVSMDSQVGNLAKGDVLIEGKKIKDIGPDLGSAAAGGKAIVIDSKDAILMPGFIDAHIHAWEAGLGRLIPNADAIPNDNKHNYFTVIHQIIGPGYRPQDIYIGNLLTGLECIDTGITCFCDNSHNTRTAAHADNAIRGLMDSGVRAVYAGGGIRYPEQQWDHQWPDDLVRIKKQYFASDDQLVTMRAFLAGAVDPKQARVARDLDLWISWDAGSASPVLPQWYKDGLLVGKESFNHGGGTPDANWQLIREHGAKLNVCPRADTQAGYGGEGRGFNALQDALDHGVRPGLSSDNGSAYASDMFLDMKVLYTVQRGLAQLSKFNGNPKYPAAVTVRDVLEFATIRGAECNALDRKCGSLTPGKEADLLMIRTDTVRHTPLNNAFGAIVHASTRADLDAVFIAGQAKKWRGQMTNKLVAQDFNKVRQLAEESRQYVLAKANWPLDIFSD
jgi:5-methylthioadenosine/S-adenosylhomocysteine deaminase